MAKIPLMAVVVETDRASCRKGVTFIPKQQTAKSNKRYIAIYPNKLLVKDRQTFEANDDELSGSRY